MKKVIPLVSERRAAPPFTGGKLVDTRARPMRDLRILDYERHTLEYALR